MSDNKPYSFKGALEDILKLSTKYLSDDIDKNRMSTFGYITESMARSVEDSLYRSYISNTESIIELSNNEDNIRAVAKIRGLKIMNPQPARIPVILYINKEDIIYNGVKDGRNYHFILDKRSKLIINDIPFTLYHDIKINATWFKNRYIYTANYTGHIDSDEYVICYDFKPTDGSNKDSIGLFIHMTQVDYKIEERTITDMDKFTYEGMSFDHGKMNDFTVEKKTNNEWKVLPKAYARISNPETNGVLYNDDAKDLLLIYNDRRSNLRPLDELRVTIKETLGAGGNFDIFGLSYKFVVYSDDFYKFTGVDITATLMGDAVGGKDEESIEGVKWELINQKLSRNILITDKDIKNALSNKNDVIIRKKRNDIRFRYFDIYQLFRDGKEIVPTCTKNVILNPLAFNTTHSASGIRVMKAYNNYTLIPNTKMSMQIKNNWEPTESWKEAMLDPEKTVCKCPFSYTINKYNMLTYFLTAIDKQVRLRPDYINDLAPYQMILTDMKITRNPYVYPNDDLYNITVTGILNGSGGHEDLIDATGNILPTPAVDVHAVFELNKSPQAYLKLRLASYNKNTDQYTFTGEFRSDDYVTEQGKLSVQGMTKVVESSPSNLVIDFENVKITLAVSHKDAPAPGSELGVFQSNIPAIKTRTLLAVFDNTRDKFNLILDCGKFTRSPVELLKPLASESPLIKIHEVPLIRADYLLKNYGAVYKFLAELQKYNRIIERMVENTLNIKFINTYGQSRFIYVGENDTPLKNLNPLLKFKLYGKNIDIEPIKARILQEFHNFKADNQYIFISNINTIIEKEFPEVESIEFLSVDSFDHTHQKFKNDIDQL